MGLHAIRSPAKTAQTSNYTRARLENYAHLQLMKRLVHSAKDNAEASDILKKYITHNTKFERQMFIELSKEIAQGKEWDDTELDEQQQQQRDEGGNFLGGLLSSFTSLFGSPQPAPQQPQQPREQPFRIQREDRNDDVSNLLWNMTSTNMI